MSFVGSSIEWLRIAALVAVVLTTVTEKTVMNRIETLRQVSDPSIHPSIFATRVLCHSHLLIYQYGIDFL